jgi:cell wall integrity and stress response component
VVKLSEVVANRPPSYIMLSSSSLASSVATVVLAIFMATPAAALDGAQTPTLMGCYASGEGLTYNDTVINQSSGHCQGECFPLKKAVMAMINAKDCWCGDNMPPLAAKVDDSKCDTPCAGYPLDICTCYSRRFHHEHQLTFIRRVFCWSR